MATISRRNQAQPQRSERFTVGVIVFMAILVVGFLLWRTIQSPFIVKAKLGYADGLKLGAQVQLAGVKVGSVKEIRFLSVPSKDSDKEVFEIIMALSPTEINHQPIGELIRKDGQAVLISSGALGDRSINIIPGTTATPAIKNNDYIAGVIEPNVAMLMDNSDTMRDNFNRAEDLLEQNGKFVKQGNGTIGKLSIPNNEFNRNLKDLMKATDDLQKIIDHGHGTIAKIQHDEELGKSLDHIVAMGEQLRTNLQQGKGSAGKFLNDPEFQKRLDHLQASVNHLSTRFDRLYSKTQTGSGSLAKFSNKDFSRDVNALKERFNKISAKINTGQGTVGLIMHDERLAQNVAAISAETLKLAYDFSQKPTKYIKFTFF